MSTDAELLHRYVEQRDERAFADLVQRHLGLVYSAALRRTDGRAHLAEEISQDVFSTLARKAPTLLRHPALTGWLYQSARFAAIDAIRAELRRQKLAQTLTAMPDTSPVPEAQVDWEHLRPVIDQAMDQLKERDREIMLLRFFNGLSFVEIGARLNLTENAARMRTERALDKLRGHLGSSGVSSTTSALGLLLSNSSLVGAPAGLAASVSTTALASVSTGAATGILSLILMSKFTAPLLSAAIAAGLTALVYTSVAHTITPSQVAALRQENARLSQATAAGASASTVSEVANEFATQAAAIVQAVERKHANRTAGPSATAQASSPQPGAKTVGYRNVGQATSHDAIMSFAWACDAAEIEALSKLIYFDGNGREEALAVLATMPESLRVQYRTPEELYAFFLTLETMMGPPPSPEVIEKLQTVEAGPGRVSLQRSNGRVDPNHQYQQTPEGWKFVIPAQVVRLMPNILNSDVLANSSTP